ncbi:hypothetical protein STEG23_019807, partial [Scotinomys teguina]
KQLREEKQLRETPSKARASAHPNLTPGPPESGPAAQGLSLFPEIYEIIGPAGLDHLDNLQSTSKGLVHIWSLLSHQYHPVGVLSRCQSSLKDTGIGFSTVQKRNRMKPPGRFVQKRNRMKPPGRPIVLKFQKLWMEETQSLFSNGPVCWPTPAASYLAQTPPPCQDHSTGSQPHKRRRSEKP